jgi:hypothetical protein
LGAAAESETKDLSDLFNGSCTDRDDDDHGNCRE